MRSLSPAGPPEPATATMRLRGSGRGDRDSHRRGATLSTSSPEHRSVSWTVVGAAIIVVAFTARLVPVLRGGGLRGLGNYDDGVYYAAAVGLVHGRLPYRDFLLLHPPGIVLALAPFAALGRWLGDSTGFTIARLAWMVMGAICAVLVMRILRSHGRAASALGGLFFAVFYPAVYSQHTTELEGLATFLVLGALVLLEPIWHQSACPAGRGKHVVNPRRRAAASTQPLSRQTDSRQTVPDRVVVTTGRVLTAGALLGGGAATKIWGVVVVVAVAGWLLIVAGRLLALRLTLGAVLGAAVVCLPFFLADPRAMARMVVQDQMGRPDSIAAPWTRFAQIIGQHGIRSKTALIAIVLALGILVLAGTLTATGRMSLAVLAVCLATLMLTPSWFLHYTAFVAAPLAVSVGAGAGVLVRCARSRGGPVAAAVATAGLLALVAAYASPLAAAHTGTRFPAAALRVSTERAPGCVTSDDPATLVELNVLGRNLDRSCPLVIDLGGRSYDVPPVAGIHRTRDRSWQRYALDYLRSGDVTIIARFVAGGGFSRGTANVVNRWPILAHSGHFSAQTPRTP